MALNLRTSTRALGSFKVRRPMPPARDVSV